MTFAVALRNDIPCGLEGCTAHRNKRYWQENNRCRIVGDDVVHSSDRGRRRKVARQPEYKKVEGTRSSGHLARIGETRCRRCARNTPGRRSESGGLEWVVNSPAALRVRKPAICNTCFATPASMLGSSWRRIRTSRATKPDTSSEREFPYRSPLMPTGSGAWQDRVTCFVYIVRLSILLLVRSVKAVTDWKHPPHVCWCRQSQTPCESV